MTRLVRPLVTGAVVAVAVLATASPAAACSCAPVELADIADDVDVAFVGEQTDRAGSGDTVALAFAVDEVYEGRVAETVSVRTASDSAACGVDYAGQGRVAVVAFETVDGLSTDLCSSLVDAADFEPVFGPAGDPEPAPGDDGAGDEGAGDDEGDGGTADDGTGGTADRAPEDSPAFIDEGPVIDVVLTVGLIVLVAAGITVALLRARRHPDPATEPATEPAPGPEPEPQPDS